MKRRQQDHTCGTIRSIPLTLAFFGVVILAWMFPQSPTRKILLTQDTQIQVTPDTQIQVTPNTQIQVTSDKDPPWWVGKFGVLFEHLPKTEVETHVHAGETFFEHERELELARIQPEELVVGEREERLTKAITIMVTKEEAAKGELSEASIIRAAQLLAEYGAVLLAGHSLFSDKDLDATQAYVQGKYAWLRQQAADDHISGPWAIDEEGFTRDFWYREAVSYMGSGRMDMHWMPHRLPIRDRSDLNQVCRRFYNVTSCASPEQDLTAPATGALFNFPGSVHNNWHRDARADTHTRSCFTIFVAGVDHPTDSGHTQLQLKSHLRPLYDEVAIGHPLSNELVIQPRLRRGNALIFNYELKHATSANPSPITRILYYAVYGPSNVPRKPYGTVREVMKRVPLVPFMGMYNLPENIRHGYLPQLPGQPEDGSEDE